MTDDNPDRLHETSEDPELRALLGAGRRELPDAQQLGAVLAKLGPTLGGGGNPPGGGGGVAPPGKAAAVTKSAWVGVAKLAAVAVGVGAAVWGAQRLTAHSDPSTDAAVATVAPASARAPEAPAPPPGTTEPAVPSSVPSAPSVAAKPRALSAPSSSAPPDPEAEVKLVERAQDALATDPATAYRLAEESARRFPHGDNRQEAEVIAIAALLATNRRAAAEERARTFRTAYPASTHLRRIDTLLAQRP